MTRPCAVRRRGAASAAFLVQIADLLDNLHELFDGRDPVARSPSARRVRAWSDNLLSRFLRYVRIDTQSDETSKTFPSTPGQLVLLEMLKQELSELGAADVQMTKHGYVMASIPANTRKARVPTVAFLAHVDTAPDCSGKNVKPIVHRKYDGTRHQVPG